MTAQSINEQVKAWAAPVLFLAILALAGYIWTMQQARISTLELQATVTSNTLSAISANQAINTSDRADFQASTTARLDKLNDVLVSMGQNIAALTALQKSEKP